MGKKTQTSLDSKFTLFVKFSRRVPNSVNIVDGFKELDSSVVNVRKPRSKAARWALVDFETEEAGNDFKKLLTEKKFVKGIQIKTSKLVVRANESNDDDNNRKQYVNTLTKKTFESEAFLDKYSNKLMVTNLPENVTIEELKELFPDQLSLDLKHTPKRRAIISFSTAKEAMAQRIAVRPILNGQKIKIITLLLQTEAQKKNIKESSKSDSTATPSKKRKTNEKKSTSFVRKPRYFETPVE
ncbi:unnamed protein product [Diamesa serratosioi]